MTDNGFVLWEGNSLFDGEPIVVIVTGYKKPSVNNKTGDMLQSWIIKQNNYPSENIKNNTDNSICGNCPLKGKSCYVTMMAPNNIWRQYKEGQYPKLNLEHLQTIKLEKRLLRLGAYGDPCAVSLQAWQPLIEVVYDYTGYTHAWQYTDLLWSKYIRASVESVDLKNKANRMGWKTFRIATDINTIQDDEVVCRNLEDKEIQCEDCRLCNGGINKPNVLTLVHGTTWKVTNFKELVNA